MSIQNLIIYKFTELYHILEELGLDLNFKIIPEDTEKSLNQKVKYLNNYLVVTNKKRPNIGNQLVLDNTPINIFKLVEKINIEFLKLQFNSQSEFIVNNYTIDLNSREIFRNNTKLKLTEKDLKRIFPKKTWSKLHLQIIFYGREYCKARNCYGLSCKICTTCYPNRKKPVITKKA